MSRLTAGEIAGWLRAVAGGQVAVSASRAPVPDGDVVIHGGGWAVMLLTDDSCAPRLTCWAVAPGGRDWVLGCERDWLALGPPVDPLELMEPLEEEGLRRVLMTLPAPPVLEGVAWWPDHAEVAARQAALAKSKGRQRRAAAAPCPAPVSHEVAA